MKKIESISFQNFPSLLLEQDLTCSNNEFINTVREKPDQTNIQQISTRNFNQDRYRKILEG